jgi:hypothetical protein
MKFFKALKKIYKYLTEEEKQVVYEGTEESQTFEQTSQEEIMLEIENPYVKEVKDWAVKKINLLHEADRHRNAKALESEFYEWINIPNDTEKLEYLCLENDEWTDEQEIDVR